MRFRDRRDAGRRLAEQLDELGSERPVVVALPRGGVPVAAEIAGRLRAPLEILAVRKLGAPGNPELAVGAVAEDETGVFDPDTAARLGMTQSMLDETVARESRELRRRVARYRGGRSPIDVRGRTVIVVDDGLATGLTDLAAVRALRKRRAAQIIVAVPVGSEQAVALLSDEADRVICLTVPKPLLGVGMWYRDFAAVSDEAVVELLARSAAHSDAPAPSGAAHPPTAGEQRDDSVPSAATRALSFDLDQARVGGELTVPDAARALVVFAHGSGSSRMSPRNRAVARALNEAGLATLLFDLLDEREAQRRELVFDVGLLAGRLQAVTTWARAEPALLELPIGYFGASTGAAAALLAAAALPEAVAAVVSRGGRVDLAGERLADVRAATLLIVGGEDRQVLALNRHAATMLSAPHELAVLAGAGHLFEEPGALEQVAALAIDWFSRHLRTSAGEAISGAGER